MTALMTLDLPILGPVYDKAHPETRQAWIDFRNGGITATQIRDWGIPSKRAVILEEKATGVTEDLSYIDYVEHGNIREPVISEWVERQFGIAPTSAVFCHAHNARHIASPDGVTLDPFSRQLVVGPDAAVLEVKTSTKDLTPGPLSQGRVLLSLTKGSLFQTKNYYTQIQWQMYVMNAAKTLFVWEVHDGVKDPETGTFTPVGPPQWCWIMRDQKLIDVLVEKVAPQALAEIDAYKLQYTLGATGPIDLPEVLTMEQSILIANYFDALEEESAATERKQEAWKALQGLLIGEGKPDFSVTVPGFAKVTVGTTKGTKRVFNEDAARAKAPAHWRDHDRIVERYTEVVPTSTQKLTVTRQTIKDVPTAG